jgi:hypothetical protein
MARYRKKPVEIDAVQWTGENEEELAEFLGQSLLHWLPDQRIRVGTLEGGHDASLGDWLIRGVQGEHYPCKPDIFDATYEAVA